MSEEVEDENWSDGEGELPAVQDKFNQTKFDLLTKRYKYCILGGGVAAGYACHQFVEEYKRLTGKPHCNGEVVVISNESLPPYERPAVTKALLYPPEATNRVATSSPTYTTAALNNEVHDVEYYKQHGIDLKLNTTAILFEPTNSSITVVQKSPGKSLKTSKISGKNSKVAKDFDFDGDKESIDLEYVIFYKKILLCTGVEPRELEADDSQAENLFTIKSVNDCEKLIKKLEDNRRAKVVVIGSGYIAVEAACAISGWLKDGGQVTVLCSTEYLLSSTLPPVLGQYLENHMKDRGNIRIVKGCKIRTFFGDSKSKYEVLYSYLPEGSDSADFALNMKRQKETIKLDFGIVAIGSKIASLDLIKKKLDFAPSPTFGVKVDEYLRSVDYKNVFVVGDIAALPRSTLSANIKMKQNFVDNYTRIEHVTHARLTAMHAVQNMCSVVSSNLENPDESLKKFESIPYLYTKLFEYKIPKEVLSEEDNIKPVFPLRFDFFGDVSFAMFENDKERNDAAVYFNANEETGGSGSELGCLWLKNDCVVAGVIWNARSTGRKAMKELVANNTKISKKGGAKISKLLGLGKPPPKAKSSLFMANDRSASGTSISALPMRHSMSFYEDALLYYKNL